jgi:type IV pilus assembly protein PilV
MAAPRPRGFTLLEVLIAIVIFSIGLLGLAGLMVMSFKTNHSAYLRTQATFIAESMADRMRGNSMAVWAKAYDSSGYPLTVTTDPCLVGGAGCDSATLATHDKYAFSKQLSTLLPNPAATIACTPTTGIVTPNPAANPPYNGLCSMQISWDESKLAKDGTATGQTTQTFAWVFQP